MYLTVNTIFCRVDVQRAADKLLEWNTMAQATTDYEYRNG
jgi:hypothetical protein